MIILPYLVGTICRQGCQTTQARVSDCAIIRIIFPNRFTWFSRGSIKSLMPISKCMLIKAKLQYSTRSVRNYDIQDEIWGVGCWFEVTARCARRYRHDVWVILHGKIECHTNMRLLARFGRFSSFFKRAFGPFSKRRKSPKSRC